MDSLQNLPEVFRGIFFTIFIILFLLFITGTILIITEIHGEETTDWKRRAELSYINTSNTATTQSLFGKFNMKKENKKTGYFIKGNVQYGESYDKIDKIYKKTVNKWLLAGKYEKKITERFFNFLLIDYIDNEFSGYNYNIIVGPGLGYDIVKTKKHYLKGFLSAVYSHDHNSNKSDSYGSRKIASDYIWQISKNIIFKENTSYLHSFESNKKYFINSETILEIKINTLISLGLNYTIAYQNYVLFKNIERAEKTFLTLIIINL